MSADVTVVSGTYNRLKLLQAMVESARASRGDLMMDFVIVDGGSKDGTQAWCKEQSDIWLIEHGKLVGAIKAYNDGFRSAKGTYTVVGNDDVTFEGDTIARAWRYLEANPEVGQVAFAHKYQRRGPGARAGHVAGAYGFTYGQCSMLRRWLGGLAGWWGDEGMKTYGGDTRLSLRLWEMGWPVVALDGCAVIDHEHEDALRDRNSDSPWRTARRGGRKHPDLEKFEVAWNHRMPHRGEWIEAPARRAVRKAQAGNLRSMRFKSGMFVGAPTRTALIDALTQYGPTRQVNQTDAVAQHGREGFQQFTLKMVDEFKPDLIIFQAQRENNVTPATVRTIRQRWPWVYTINWDGDTHYPITDFHYEMARTVHLQLIVSPTWFGHYAARGIGVGYWPIGIEDEYLQQQRLEPTGADVLFTGALYGEGVFPEAEFRRDAVVAMSKSGLQFELYGPGWPRVGLTTTATSEKHGTNAEMMARAKMTLSISQASDLWGYTSDRLYNITATGCPALVQRFAGMEQHGYVDGETCIGFGSIPEMIEKARYYLEHAEERERIGAAGRVMTHGRHTWAHRLEGLWAMLEGLP